MFLEEDVDLAKPKNDIKAVMPIAWASFLWSCSSLMVFSILPIFLSEVLQLSYTGIGIMEGSAIAGAFIAKFFSGLLSDKFKKRVPLILSGSIICVISKPLFAIATGWGMIFFSRFFDRLGKGIRSAPTDALIADLSDVEQFSHAYSVRQCLYALGTVLGSVIAMSMLYIYGPNYRLVFICSIIPAIIAVWLIYKNVRDTNKSHIIFNKKYDFVRDITHFSPLYWLIILMTMFLMIARFSEMFLVLRSKQLGWPIHLLPLIIIIIDLLHSAFSFLNRRLIDRFSSHKILSFGIVLLMLADFVFSIANSQSMVILGILLAGIHLGITQGLLRSLIAKNSPSHLYGTAFAIFYFISGIGVFLGNYIAGYLADNYNLTMTFVGGLIATTFAFVLSYAIQNKQPTAVNS